MSSDSEKLPKPSKRRRQIVSDSESSDDSFIVSNRGKRSVSRVISEGESSDDDSDIPLRTVQKRKNHKLVSEDELSYDSSSSNGGARSNFEGGSTSSEWQSDWESMDESCSEAVASNQCKKSPNKAKSSDSENSDGESDKCPICLLSFRKQEIANPATCEHCFCLDCLIEWSKNINTCPVDRQTFTVINVRAKIGGKIIRHVPIEAKSPTEEVVQEDPTYCEVCQRCDREDRMLLCDGCDSGYHLECLDPPMDEVPLDERWFCPECSRNSQNDAEDIEIDLDEVPDLMEEVRQLGLAYGRSRASLAARGFLNGSPPRSFQHPRNVIPRTRQTERVRANVRAGRSRRAAAEVAAGQLRRNRAEQLRQLQQPSTSSSGIESISENSRTRSPMPGPSSSRRATSGSRRAKAASSATRKKIKRKTKTKRRKTTSSRRSTEYREVRIEEINENGEVEEIVTYVRAGTSAGGGGPLPSGRRRKKRKKRKQRRARTVASVAAARCTAKRRLATFLKMMKPSETVGRDGVQLMPAMKIVSTPSNSNSELRVARHNAGIPQLSLFGGGLGLDFSPPGSDNEYEEESSGATGLLVRSVRPAATRRRLGLKAAIAEPILAQSSQSIDLLSSILDSQEIWHSRKAKVSLKADGSFHINKPNKKPECNNNNNNSNNNNNNSPIKIKPNNEPPRGNNRPLDLTNVDPSSLRQQAPMYNSPRGGNRGGGGNYRGGGGGGNYRDNNRHSYGGPGGGGGGGQDSYGGGRHSFGGSSNVPQDYSSTGPNYHPPPNFNDHRNQPNQQQQQPPSMSMPPPFRNRTPQNFRNRFPPPGQMNQQPPQSQQQQNFSPFGHDQFARPRVPRGFQGVPPPPPPLALRMPMMQNSDSSRGPMQGRDMGGHGQTSYDGNQKYGSGNEGNRSFADDDCDMYGDLPAPPQKGSSQLELEQEGEDSADTLLPPPEPPSDLLDFDESERGQDSDREDLVIDDTPREDGRSAGAQHADKYDPFAADSDSDEEQHSHGGRLAKGPAKPPPLKPPPGLSEFPGLKNDENESILGDGASIMGDNASIMGDNASIMGDNASIMGDNMSVMGDDEDDYPSSAKSTARKSKGSRPLEPPPAMFNFPGLSLESDVEDNKKEEEKKKEKKKVVMPRIRLTAYDDDDDDDSDSDCPNFSIYSSETMDVARNTEKEMSSQIGPLEPPPMPPEFLEQSERKQKPNRRSQLKPLEPPPMPPFGDEEDHMESEREDDHMTPLEPPPMPPDMLEDDLRSKAGSPASIAPLEPPPMPPMEELDEEAPLEPPPMPPDMLEDDLRSKAGTPESIAPLEPPPMPPIDALEDDRATPAPALEPPPMLSISAVLSVPPPPLGVPPMIKMLDPPPPLEPPPIPPLEVLEAQRATPAPPLEPPPIPPLEALVEPTVAKPLEPPPLPPLEAFSEPAETDAAAAAPLEPPPMPPIDDLNLDEESRDSAAPLEPPPIPPSILGDDEAMSTRSTSESESGSDEASAEEEEPVIGPKNKGGRKRTRSVSSKKNEETKEQDAAAEDEDVIVGDVQPGDLTEGDAPHSLEYADAVQKERQTLNKTSGKIQLDSRGKITFKIGNLSRLNKVNLYDELDEAEISKMTALDIERESNREREGEKEKEKEKEKDKERDKDKDRDRDRDRDKDRDKDRHKDKSRDKEKDREREKDKGREKEKDKDSKRKDHEKSEKDRHDSKRKDHEKDSKGSRHDDKKSSRDNKSSKSSKYDEKPKDSKGKHSSKSVKESKEDKPKTTRSGWDIKPPGMTSSESGSESDDSVILGSPVRKDSPIVIPDSPSRPSSKEPPITTAKSMKQINIDLDELQQTLDKRLVELEDLAKLHPDDDDDVAAVIDDANKLIKESEEGELFPTASEIGAHELEEEVIPANKEVAAPVVKPLDETESLLEEIEKSCDVPEVATAVDATATDTAAEKEDEEIEDMHPTEMVAIEEPKDNGLSDNISVKSMDLDIPDEKDLLEEVEAEHELAEKESEMPTEEVTEKVSEEHESEKESEKEDEDEDEDKEERRAAAASPEAADKSSDKSEVIDLDSAEFTDKPVFVGDLDNDGFQIESADAAKLASTTPVRKVSKKRVDEWEGDGAFTPCKDERPVPTTKNLDLRVTLSNRTVSLLESGLEPITPIKDRISDGLDGCRTPAGYAGLGTEAISETDEAMNFEDELALLNMRSRDKDVEEGEIPDDRPRKQRDQAAAMKAKELMLLEEEAKRKRKKERKDKSKETLERNKENIASENNLLSSWKKASKVVLPKERQYREKRSKSKDPKAIALAKKKKEAAKKKEKRKELPRYDVRKLVTEKPRPRKDEYGRDIRDSSRSRSLSLSRERSLSYVRRSRSYTPRGRRHSRSRSRSWSRGRRSRSYRSLSRRRSHSPQTRARGREKLRKRSLSRGRGRSRSRSITPRGRRRERASLSPPRRKSRRDTSKKRQKSRSRSRSRSRSHSRSRRKEKKKVRSPSRTRLRKRSRSKSVKKRDKKHAKRSKAASRSRSRSLDRRNWEHHQLALADKVVERNFREPSWAGQWTPSWSRSRSKTPPIVRQENIARNWSPPPMTLLNSVNVPPKNLKVILTNKEAIKKKKKEKRKESRKVKEAEKKRKNKKVRSPPPSKEVFASGDNILVSVCFNKDNEAQPTTGLPELPETIPLLPPVKRRRREPLSLESPSTVQIIPAKKSKKDKAKDKREKSPAKPVKKKEKKKSKAAEIAASKKPMAVIDLDQSPFREQTPSPRDVIVLSDDDDKQAQVNDEIDEMGTPEQPQESHTPARPDPQFLQGPKTPPEPQVKFSITNKQNNLRPSLMNPLLEEEEEEMEEEMSMNHLNHTAEMEELMDEQVEEELELRAQEELESRMKVGPNTPPEPPTSPPTSPDAYDPFDPTKSRSPTPEPNSQEDSKAQMLEQGGDSPFEPGEDEPPLASETGSQADQQEAKPAADKPKIISMVTIKRPSPNASNTPPLNDLQSEAQEGDSPVAASAAAQQSSTATTTSQQQQQQQQQTTVPQVNPFPAINPVLATVAAAVQRSSIFSSTQLVVPRNLLTSNTLIQNTQIKQQQVPQQPRPTLPNIFANSMPKPMPMRTIPMKQQASKNNMSMLGQNGSDANIEISNDNIDMSSPYSPGSSLSDGLFDPPSPANVFNSSPNVALSTKIRKNQEKKDAFDALFDASPIVHKSSMKVRMQKKNEKDKRKKGTHSKIGVRMDENQLQILDDLPSSAVEMQVKDKFLKKLNRQERVVEEVKLVLKPHYTKKHVTKEEYKDIMRKAVPKICHNKSGEINPKKIAALIEAYVKKVRSRKKAFGNSAPTANSVKKPAKTLWS